MTMLIIKSPADLLAALPFCFGFHPQNSLVVAAIDGARLSWAARADLPEPGASTAAARVPIVQLATTIAENRPAALALVGYGAGARVTPSILRLSQAMTMAGVPIIGELRVDEGRYWSYNCPELTCCPIEGRPCPPADSLTAAEATYAGAVALPGRKDLEARIAPVTGAERRAMDRAGVEATSRLLGLYGAAAGLPDAATAGPPVTAEQKRIFNRLLAKTGRKAVRAAERCHRTGGRLSDKQVAWLAIVLQDLRVRDYAWCRSGTDDWQVSLWTDLARRTDPVQAAAPAAMLAFVAWRAGLAPVARIAVDRALRADEDYPMARLMDRILGSPLPPSVLDGWPDIPGLDEFLRFDPDNTQRHTAGGGPSRTKPSRRRKGAPAGPPDHARPASRAERQPTSRHPTRRRI